MVNQIATAAVEPPLWFLGFRHQDWEILPTVVGVLSQIPQALQKPFPPSSQASAVS